MKVKILIIVLLGISTIYQIVLRILKQKAIVRPIPDSVKDIYDEKDYQRWLNYQNEKNRFEFINGLFNSVLLIVLFVFNILVNFSNILPENLYTKSIVIVIAYYTLTTLLNIPFDYYRQMVIEDKYGFNKTTIKTFIVDEITGYILNIIITSGLLMLFTLYEITGNWILVIFTLVVFVFIIIINLISPFLVKIRNKIKPLENESLKIKLEDLLERNGYKVKEICVIDGSKRSTKANAFFIGMGKLKKIMLYDTLLTQLSEDEIVAVFAHEMGHGIHKDIVKNCFRSFIMIFVIVFIYFLMVSNPNIIISLGLNSFNYGLAYIILFEVVLNFVSPIVSFFTNYLSRKAEYAADKFAASKGYGKDLINSLKILTKNSLSNINPHPVIVAVEYSHPPLWQRIDNINNNNSR